MSGQTYKNVSFYKIADPSYQGVLDPVLLYFRFRITAQNQGGDGQWEILKEKLLKGDVRLFCYKEATDLGVKSGMAAGSKEIAEHKFIYKDDQIVTEEDVRINFSGYKAGEKPSDYLKIRAELKNWVTGQVHWNESISTCFFTKRAEKMNKQDYAKLSVKLSGTPTKLTVERTNVLTVAVSQGAGWYLVKQKESYDALINRIFKTPTDREHSVMREINKHLTYSFDQLQPGQVVIVALEKNNPKVKSMMKEAENAQKVWAEQSRLHSIDATFLMLLDLKLQKHALKTLDSKSFVSEAVGMIDAGKPYVDGTLKFNEEMFKSSGSAYEKMMKAAGPAFDNVTTVGGMTKRGVSAAGQNASKAYQMMDGAVARKLFEWDTGIQADKARDFISQEARVRQVNYQKGITNIADEMATVGKYSKWLKAGGTVGIVLEVGVSGYKFNEAREKGDNKGMITETGQLAGSLGGGSAGGYVGGLAGAGVVMALGLATGGVGLVVIGIFVAGGAYLGGEGGKVFLKKVTDKVNEHVD
jgi:hypothetical protein